MKLFWGLTYSFVCALASADDGVTAALVVEKLAQQVRRWNSLQFNYSYSFPIAKDGKAITFRADGTAAVALPRLYLSQINQTSELENYRGQCHFAAGSERFELQLEDPELKISKGFAGLGKPAYSMLITCPLFKQFPFLLKELGNKPFDEWGTPAYWAKVTTMCETAGYTEKDGKRYLTATIKSESGDRFTLYLDPKSGFYPMIVEIAGAYGTATTIVTEIREYPTAKGPLFLPLEISTEEVFFPDKKTPASLWHIDPGSVKVDLALTKERFQIPLTNIESVYDANLGDYVRFSRAPAPDK